MSDDEQSNNQIPNNPRLFADNAALFLYFNDTHREKAVLR